MSAQIAMNHPDILTLMLTGGVSALSALAAVVITYVLTRRREHEADWRKLKLAQYQNFVLALSGVVQGRATLDAHRKYADAVNSMSLVAPTPVLKALDAFQQEISFANRNRVRGRHDELLDVLFRAMRNDVHPGRAANHDGYTFHLLGLPPAEVMRENGRNRSEKHSRRVAMIKVTASAIAFLAMLSMDAASAATDPKMEMGIGVQTCGQFAAAYRDDPHVAETIYFTWAQGFMSGQNVLVVLATGKTVDLSGMSMDALQASIRDYCDAHPLAMFDVAVENLYRSLPAPPEVTSFLKSVAGASPKP